MPSLKSLSTLIFLCTLRIALAFPSNFTDINSSPRIADVIAYMEDNGGVNWIDTGDGTRYTYHKYKEWAAAENAVAGQDTGSFIVRMASKTFTVNGSSELGSPTPGASGVGAEDIPKYPRYAKRDSSGKWIKGGLLLGPYKRGAKYFCFNSGQWGSTSALVNMAGPACSKVMVDGMDDGVHTWQSLGYVQPDHHTAAWFVQRSGTGGDTHALSTCAQIFNGWRIGGIPKGAQPWCGGTGSLGSAGGPWTTQGGYVRWYNSREGALFTGSQRGELRIDPNRCYSNGKPCSNVKDLAKGPESLGPQ